MVTYYCPHCWFASPCFLKYCPKCKERTRFFTEQQYADLMIRYLHHPLREYRSIALKNLAWLKWKDAIPEIQERIRIEKEPEVRLAARQALTTIEIFHNQTGNTGTSLVSNHTPMYADICEPTCRIIPIRQIIRKHGHYHLRLHKNT